MKLGHTNDEIKFAEITGTVTRFVLILDGEETMDILCDLADAEKTIRVRRSNRMVPDTQDTKGCFTVETKFLEDSEGQALGVADQVDTKSVFTYVIPRLHVLLGRLLRAAG